MKSTSIKVSAPAGSLFQRTARQADANRGLELLPASERKAQVELSWQELDDCITGLGWILERVDDPNCEALKARLTSIRNRL